MKKVLVVNADDFGFDPGVDAGIAAAHREGIVTATSCMVTSARFAEAAATLRAEPGLDAGVHVDLTWGTPRAGASRELAPGGRFRSKRGLVLALLAGRVPEDVLAREIAAQVDAFEARLGSPSHLDVHQHFHVFRRVHRALLRVARDRGIGFVRHPAEPPGGPLAARLVSRAFRRRARPRGVRTTDHFRGLALTGTLDVASLRSMIAVLPAGVTELMVHPGEQGAAGVPDRLAASRAAEGAALRDPALREALADAGVRLAGFRDL